MLEVDDERVALLSARGLACNRARDRKPDIALCVHFDTQFVSPLQNLIPRPILDEDAIVFTLYLDLRLDFARQQNRFEPCGGRRGLNVRDEDLRFPVKLLEGQELHDVQNDEQNAVRLSAILADASGPAQDAREELDRDVEPISFVTGSYATERENAAGRVFIQLVRIVGRFSGGVEEPAIRRRFIAVTLDTNLALGRRRWWSYRSRSARP